MELVAKIYDWNIYKTELDFEESIISYVYNDDNPLEIRALAINRLVDRYLLLKEAIDKGTEVSDEEIDNAIMELLDRCDSPVVSILIDRFGRGDQLEQIIRTHLMISKYISSLETNLTIPSEDRLKQFYEERKDFFCRDEEVRVSQILLKGKDDEIGQRIQDIRKCIKCRDDFYTVQIAEEDDSTKANRGDLGYFPRGRMLHQIDNVAFSLALNEVSQPFKTRYGYHILLMTDKKEKQTIPYEEIRDCLKNSVTDIEEELSIARILHNARERARGQIEILITVNS